jgi:hypothetical protein
MAAATATLCGAGIAASAQLAYASGPTISGFTPSRGPVGTTVAISGTGFTNVTKVLFGLVSASTYTVESSSLIDADVPVGATRGRISVHTTAGNVSSHNQYYKVTPSVTGFGAPSAQTGQSVTVEGSGFFDVTKVAFNGVDASTYSVDSYGQITATVPAGASTGPVTVTNKFGSGTSSSDLTIVQVFNVLDYGANPNDTGDNTPAFHAAIAAAQTAGAGSEVYVPSGTYTFASGSPASIQITGSVPIILAGAGRDSTKLVELTERKDLLSIRCDGTTVQDLSFDTQTYNGGHGIGDGANYTTVQRVAVYSGTETFGIYYMGPPGAHPGNGLHSEGNVVNDVILNDHYTGDGWSFSFQDNASVSNVVHTGSRITLYADTNTTVTNYNYTPGNYGATAAFVISTPCVNLTITNFTTAGEGGQIKTAPDQARVNQNITINNEQMTATAPAGQPPYRLLIGDVQGLTVENSSLQNITIAPKIIAQGTVTNTTYTGVTNRPAKGATDDITFN